MADEPCIAAGFFVTEAGPRHDLRSPDLLPSRLVSLSPCIARSYQVYWAWDPAKHREDALAFGIAESRLADLLAWERGHGISYPNVFHTLDDARSFAGDLLPARDEVMVLGAGLPASLVDAFLRDHEQEILDGQTGTKRKGSWGVPHVGSLGRPLPDGGEPLGFDTVLYGHNLECSWLCTGTERTIFEALGLRPNAHGLIERFDDAMRAHAWLEAHPDEGEPGPYYPWAIVRYPR
jgi:hypothetical protein